MAIAEVSTPIDLKSRIGSSRNPGRNAESRRLLGITLYQIGKQARPHPSDDEDPVTSITVSFAQQIAKRIYLCVESRGMTWVSPFVTSDDAGHIHLVWDFPNARFRLVADGCRIPTVTTLLKREDRSDRDVVDLSVAANWAADLICNGA